MVSTQYNSWTVSKTSLFDQSLSNSHPEGIIICDFPSFLVNENET